MARLIRLVMDWVPSSRSLPMRTGRGGARQGSAVDLPNVITFNPTKSSWRPSREINRRQPQHPTDPVRPRCDHRQPIKSQRDSRGWRHSVREGSEEILVDLPVRTVQRMAPRAIGDKTLALLDRIGQLHERVGEFDATDKQLEPL